jgi:hypothetical protein
MTTSVVGMTTRISAALAPAFLFLYGILRWIDGFDGHRGGGVAWNLGHTFFLISVVLLGLLALGLRHRIVVAAPGQRRLAAIATTVALAGTACFLWVILGDLFPAVRAEAHAPGPVQLLGPVLFQAGVLCLLIQLGVARRLPLWSPVLLAIGFGMIGLNLDLLPLGAALVGVGLAPLASSPQQPVSRQLVAH